MKVSVLAAVAMMALAGPMAVNAQPQLPPSRNALAPFVGTWTLEAADVVHPDGRREADYGPAPKGLFMVDAQGRYSLQIFRSDRPHFASGDRAKGTPEEYAAAVLGTSTHIGTVSVDPATKTITFRTEAASFPNQDGTVQKRSYELRDGVLSY